ncbi:MAG: site-specific integrase [Elusimicrobia bacterium]|nr:site-specific integrase [Elusimicrobiota bacterium]
MKEFAEKFRAKKLEELYAGKLGIAQAPTETPWREFATRYLAHCKAHKAPRTYTNFDKWAVDHFTAFVGNRSLASITGEDVARWESRLLENGSPNTARIRLRAVRTAFNWAVREGLITRTPSFHMPPADDVGRTLSDPEVVALMAALPDWLKPPVVFALHTGVRRGEMLSLAWERIQRPAGGLWEAEIGGVGGPTTKTRQSRIIPLHPRARDAMGTPRARGLVFDFSPSSIVHAIEGAARKASLGRIRFHDFRHTWATRFMQATGDLFALMRLGGWTSMGSVRVYQHLTKARSDSVILVNYPPISPLKSGDIDGKDHA